MLLSALPIPALSCALLLAAAPARADLVGHWTFNGDYEDRSGMENHGMPEGGAALSSQIPEALGSGQSLELDGTGHVLVPHSSSLDLEDAMTLAAWVRPVGNVGWDGIVAKNPSPDSTPNQAGNFEVRLNASNRRLEFLCQQGGANDTRGFSAANAAIPEGEWTHIAVTAELIQYGDIKFYVNGELAEEMLDVLSSLDFFPLNENPVYIGNRADGTTTPFNGFIDDVRIYSAALGGEEIAALAEGAGASLSSSLFSSALPAGSTIATLAKYKPEEGESYAFALVPGEGDDDNGKFAIEGDELKTGSYDFSSDEDGTEYSLRIESAASGSGERTAGIFLLRLEGDSDRDGLPDSYERMFAGDLSTLSGLGEADADQDGLTDLAEHLRYSEGELALDPTMADSDGDTLRDGDEVAGAGSRPPTSPVLSDTDGDGLGDEAEDNTGNYVSGSQTGTDPTLPDTDGDGLGDAYEIDKQGDPSDPSDNAPASLLGLWRFDSDGPVTTPDFVYASDATGNGHDGRHRFATLVHDDVPELLGSGLSVRFGKGLEFEPDVIRVVDVAHHEDLDIADAVSMAAWVKPTGEGAWDGILAKNPSPDSGFNQAGNYEFRIHSTSRSLQFLSQQGGVDDTAVFTGAEAKVPSETWTHVAITAQTGSGNIRYFVDGELAQLQEGAIGYESFPLNKEPLYIGNRADGFTEFDGLLDDVAIFRGVLTAAQVQAIRKGDFSGFGVAGDPPPPGLKYVNLRIVPNSKSSSLHLAWDSSPGDHYMVMASEDLAAWRVLYQGESTGETSSYADSGALLHGPKARFYRILPLPLP